MFFQWQGDDLLLDIRVQPRASSDGFAEEPGDRIKLRITAPAVDGKSNRHLIALLARTPGHTGRGNAACWQTGHYHLP